MKLIPKLSWVSLFLLLFPFLTISTACSTKAEIDPLETKNKRSFKVWALADIQPNDQSDMDAFTDAVNDVNKISNDIDIAIVAGDIASRPEKDTYQWYNKTKSNSYIKKWHEILGNHDLKDDDGAFFTKIVNERTNYSVQYGNILFIFMSDSKKGKPMEITDETFKWWKELVQKNQDKIIAVVTHAPLEGSSIAFSSLEDRQIIKSERFTRVLDQYKVDLWISGHLHLPHAFTNTIVTNEEYPHTVFVHVSSIRPELMGFKNSESRFLVFYCDTNRVKIISRDHDSEQWHPELERGFNMRNKILCGDDNDQ